MYNNELEIRFVVFVYWTMVEPFGDGQISNSINKFTIRFNKLSISDIDSLLLLLQQLIEIIK